MHVYTDGSVHLNHGGTEMGQGLHTKVAQVVAEEFQIDLDRVRITATTTGKVPNTSATAASSGTDLNGQAALAAARTIKHRLIDFAAEHWSVPKEQVVFLPNRVRVGNQEIPFRALVWQAYMGRVSLSSTGFYKTPKIHWDRASGTGRPFYYFAYGAACSEVMIDTLTGEYRVERVDILHDCGKSLNPALDIGQIEGGFVQGMGWLTTEELWWDGQGRLRTHAPSTYKIPACGDRPRIFNVHLFENENREDAIFRSKAVGEPPLMLGISVLHAISDAVASVAGHRICPRLDAPATPERVLDAVERLRARGRPGGARRVSERLGRGARPSCWPTGVPAVLVTVAEAKGSTPREAGAAMLVTAERSFGTIGGGRLEWEGIAHARALLRDGGRESRVELPLGPGGRPVLRRPCRPAAAPRRPRPSWPSSRRPRPRQRRRCRTVLLFGAGHVGRALAAALAPLPLRLRWIDGRADEFPAAPPAGVEVVVTDRPLAEIEQRPGRQRRLRPDPQPQPRLHAVQRRARARRLRLSRADRLGAPSAPGSSAASASSASPPTASPPWPARSAAPPCATSARR